ncbi:MAG: MFS transporter [Bdellovibrionaceae bacterium]|nr:MFS transporter [Pseudobdellovibrionaceae bacterium]
MENSKYILTQRLSLLLTFSVGVIAANLYYAQPLTAQISHALGLEPTVAGLVVTLTQIGYGLGVLFLVPLGDLVENRKLILSLIGLAILALLVVSTSTQTITYFASALVLGIGVSSVQMIVPYAAHLSPVEKRGQVVGKLMSGLMMGIMLSRPIAGLLTDLISWHAVFYLSAVMMLIIMVCLYLYLPKRQPSHSNIHYYSLLKSMGHLFLKYSILRRRAIYQAFMFAAFCLFWTATPLLLAGPDFHLSQSQIAIFALVGVGGAILAPIAGKMADRGLTRTASRLSMIAGALAFAITHLAPAGSTASLILLTLAAILLDGGVSSNLVLGQREIFELPAEFRGRLNSIYIAIIFIGGAFGSFIGVWAYSHGQWNMTSAVGFLLPFICLLYFTTDKNK